MVKRAAYAVFQRTPHGVRLEDLESWGFFGLLDAIRRFDPRRGVRFETFAAGRVRGSIIDGLRSEDFAPRLARKRANELEAAYLAAERRKGAPATEADVAHELRVSADRVRRLMDGLGPILSKAVPVPRRAFQKDPLLPEELGLLKDGREEGPLAKAARKDAVEECLGRLGMRARFVLRATYFHGLDLEEVGLALCLSESRVSQIRAGALQSARLRSEGSAA